MLARSLFLHLLEWCLPLAMGGFAAVEAAPVEKSPLRDTEKTLFGRGSFYSCIPAFHPERGSIFYIFIFAGCMLQLRI